MNTDIVLNCLAKVLNTSVNVLETIDRETLLTDLGMTSMSFISFIIEIEEKLEIEVSDGDLILDNFSTLNKLFKTLSKYGNAGTNAMPLKKVLILDADNVLWKGIAGEETIIIDEMVVLFQKLLLELYKKGVLLCLCSKNQLTEVKKAFLKSQMVLNEEHFIEFFANRSDKVTNIKLIANKLKLDFDSFVFADDSDYEIGYVNLNIPEISCVKVDYDDYSFYKQIIELFDSNFSSADLNRTQLYSEQKKRDKEKKKYFTIRDYNKSLQTKVICEIASPNQFERLAELSARTNRFNLSNKAFSSRELEQMYINDDYTIFYLSASDKYGDMGIVGMAVINKNVIDAFIISCRVFDRDFEFELLNTIKNHIPSKVRGIYVRTDKNYLFSNFYTDNGIEPICLN